MFGSVVTAAVLCAVLPLSQEREKVTYDDHVKPIFQRRCAACHNSERRNGGLDLTNFTNMMQGGSSGVSIEAGDAGGSYLYQLVTHDESPEMPPGGNKIPDGEIATLATWIDQGALENKGSVAKPKRKTGFLAEKTTAIGNRPETVAYPLRQSIEPHFVAPLREVSDLAVSPWAALVAVAVAKQILLYDIDNGEFLGALPFDEGRINDLKFSRSGSLLIGGGGRHGLAGRVYAWDVVSGERVFEIGDELDNVLAADLSANHALVALGGPQKMLRVFQTDDGSLAYQLKKHTDWLTAIEFSPDGVLLASGDRSGGLYLWEAETGNEYLTLGGHGLTITSLSWRSDGNVLASASEDGNVRLWEAENGRQIKSFKAHPSGVTNVRFADQGNLLTTGRDGQVKLWQQDGKLVRQLGPLGEIGVSVGYCKTTEKMVAASMSQEIKLWNRDGRDAGSLDTNPPALSHRLVAAEKAVETTKQKLSPLTEQLAERSADVAQIEKNIEQQSELRNQLANQVEQLQQAVVSATKVAQTEEQQRSVWNSEIAENENALPLIKNALDQAIAASASLPNDTELANIAQLLEKRHDEVQSATDRLHQQLITSQSQTKAVDLQISNLRSELKRQEQQLQETVKKINVFNAGLQSPQVKVKSIQASIDQLKQQLQMETDTVAKWKGEIEFDRQLKAAQIELSKASGQLDKKESQLAESEQRLRQAEVEWNRLKREKSALLQGKSNAEKHLQGLRQRDR